MVRGVDKDCLRSLKPEYFDKNNTQNEKEKKKIRKIEEAYELTLDEKNEINAYKKNMKKNNQVEKAMSLIKKREFKHELRIERLERIMERNEKKRLE